jgi:hypothetical protein
VSVRVFVVGVVMASALASGRAEASCATLEPKAALESRAHVAFIGRGLGHDKPLFAQGPDTVWHFRVERSVKGRLPRYFDAYDGDERSEDSPRVRTGERVAFFAHRYRGRWMISACNRLTPGALLAAAEATPSNGSIYEVPRPTLWPRWVLDTIVLVVIAMVLVVIAVPVVRWGSRRPGWTARIRRM